MLRTFPVPPLVGACVAALMLLLTLAVAPRHARAADPAEEIARTNKKALEAYDNLDFERARVLLEEALGKAESAGLGDAPLAARTHLHLGLVFVAGLKRLDDAKAEFRAALKIQPDIVPTSGLFNPEAQALFDTAKLEAKALPPPRRTVVQKREVEPPPPPPSESRGLFFSFAVGSGAGFSRGKVETNLNDAGEHIEWLGGLSVSRLVQVTLDGGYFLRPSLLVSVEGRLQLITGASKDGTHCSPCSPPGSALAGLVKATWFPYEGRLRPFVSGGLGAGRIRQVVKLNGLVDCGSGGNEQCFDTVAGGPLLGALGGGVAYDVGPLVLLGGATAYIGAPTLMLNVDVMIGAGLRL